MSMSMSIYVYVYVYICICLYVCAMRNICYIIIIEYTNILLLYLCIVVEPINFNLFSLTQYYYYFCTYL
jgi:hypothetical protein